MICLHCHERFANRRRGLCSPCYDDLEVRECYPGLASDPQGSEVGTREMFRPFPEPTGTSPGSPEKVAVLVRRARLETLLWHPEDRR